MPDFAARLDTRRYRILTLVWTGLILIGLSVPIPQMQTIQPEFGLDKLVHAVLFGALTVLGMRALRPESGGRWGIESLWVRSVGVGTGVAAFAVATEVYQHVWIAGRLGDPYDALADLAGALLALLAYGLRGEAHISTNASVHSS